MTGHLAAPSNADIAAAAFLIVGLLVVALRRAPGARSRFARAFCFGVIWFAIGVAPAALAWYESPRHVYLASVGWAFILALVVEGLYLPVKAPILRRAVMAAGAAVLLIYVVRLVPVLQTWHTMARISKSGVARVQEEAAAAPPGTLMIVGLPRKSWEWSSPFVLAPPFASAGLVERVHLVTPWRLHCCGPDLWNVYTRQHLRAWMQASPRPPIIALRFDPDTGALSRLTDTEFPELNQIVPVLLQTGTTGTLDGVIVDILDRLVAGHPEETPRISR